MTTEQVTRTRRFLLEASATDGAPDDEADAADELLEALASSTLPPWVFSVDSLEPQR